MRRPGIERWLGHVARMPQDKFKKKKGKKKSTPLGVFERRQIHRGVPSLLFMSKQKQKGVANVGLGLWQVLG